MSGSIIVALIRVITSPPNGCCLLSIDATATGCRSRVEQGGDHRGGAEVEGDRVAHVAGGVAGLDVDQVLVDDHRGHLEVGLPQHRRQPAQHVQVGLRLEVVDRVEQPGQVGALVGEVGSASSTYRFWIAGRRITWRPTPTVAALGRVISGGTSTARSRVAWTRQASRQPLVELLGLNVRTSWRVIGVAASTRTLHLWQVPWPPQVESIAMPFHDAESKTVTPGGTRTVALGGAGLRCPDGERTAGPGRCRRAGPARRPAGRAGPRAEGVEVDVGGRRPGRLWRVMPSRPPWRGGRRSRPCPTRRGRGTRRPP